MGELRFTDVNYSEKVLLGPYNYLQSTPGKDIRRQMILAFNEWIKVAEDKLEKISEVVTMLHTSSLLVDDVEDSSDLRRGYPVAHKIYGIAETINSANYVYILALKKVLDLNEPELINAYTEEMLNLHRGQGMEIHWRDCLICPTEEAYLNMVANKTGGLFRLAVKMMGVCGKDGRDYIRLVDLLGIYYQIRDDYMNVKSSEYNDNKGYFEDITEGKFSFLIIYAMKNPLYQGQLLSIMRQKTQDPHVKKYAASLIEQSGAFGYAVNRLQEVESQIYEEIEKLGGNERLVKVVQYLSREFH